MNRITKGSESSIARKGASPTCRLRSRPRAAQRPGSFVLGRFTFPRDLNRPGLDSKGNAVQDEERHNDRQDGVLSHKTRGGRRECRYTPPKPIQQRRPRQKVPKLSYMPSDCRRDLSAAVPGRIAATAPSISERSTVSNSSIVGFSTDESLFAC